MKKSWHILFLCSSLGTLQLQAMAEYAEPSSFESDTDEPDTQQEADKNIEYRERQEQSARKLGVRTKTATQSSTDQDEKVGSWDETEDAEFSISSQQQEQIDDNVANNESFQKATDPRIKTNSAYRMLDMTENPIEIPNIDEIEAAYQKKYKQLRSLQSQFKSDSSQTKQINTLLDSLDQAKEYLLKRQRDDATDVMLDSFDMITSNKIKPTLNTQIQKNLDSAILSNLSDSDIENINQKYDLLPAAQKELFIKNLNLMKDPQSLQNFSIEEITNEAFDNAQKTVPKQELSAISKLWNKATRFWNKFGFGKTEADYVKTVLNQAISGDTESIRLLTTTEVKDNFRNLDIKQKRAIFKTVQTTADAIGQKITESYKSTDVLDNPVKTVLKGKQQTEETLLFNKTCNELLDSLQPMLKDTERLIVTWDRNNHNLIVNVADFSTFVINSQAPLKDNATSLIRSQRLTQPKHPITQQEFQTQVENIIESYNPNKRFES